MTDIKLTGHGCSISQSSSSLMSAAVKGKPLEQVRETIAHLQGADDGARDDARRTTAKRPRSTCAPSASSPRSQGVVKFPVRIKCATLAWNTLAQALDEVGA